VIYSNACAYAIRAMTHLAMVRPDGYLLLEELCEGTDLPRHFIAKIFQDLVRKGLLVSAKGRGGGFALARPPAEIRLSDIVEAIDGVIEADQCVVGMAQCDDRQPCPYHDTWKGVKNQILAFLYETRLDTMSQTLEHKLELIGVEIPEPKSKSKPVRVP
jgi:Rrf2 family protein